MTTKYFMAGGVNSNYSADTNWSTTVTPPRVNNTTHAVDGDAVILDANSPACIIDVASACTSIVCTGYTNTLTFNNNLTVKGAVTFVATMALAGTGNLVIGAYLTWTTGGLTFPGGVSFAAYYAITVSGALTINGLVTAPAWGSAAFAGNVTFAGGVDISASYSILYMMSGTGTFTGGTITGYTGNTYASLWGNFVINGNVTFASQIPIYPGSTLKYTYGTVTTTGSTLYVSAGVGTTLDTNGITWNIVTFQGGSPHTTTLNSTLTADIINVLSSETFAGTASGFSTRVLCLRPTASATLTLYSGNTYTVTGVLDAVSDSSAIVQSIVASTVNGTKAVLTVSAADVFANYLNVTDIDNSGGNSVYAHHGVITRSPGWTNTAPPSGTTGIPVGKVRGAQFLAGGVL